MLCISSGERPQKREESMKMFNIDEMNEYAKMSSKLKFQQVIHYIKGNPIRKFKTVEDVVSYLEEYENSIYKDEKELMENL